MRGNLTTITVAPMGGDADRLYDEGVEAFRAGDAARSRRRNEESLGLATAAGDARAEARALIGLSRLAFRAANYEEVRRLSARSAERAADVGDEGTAIMALPPGCARRFAGPPTATCTRAATTDWLADARSPANARVTPVESLAPSRQG